MIKQTKPPRKMLGVSLLEVLISLVVLSIGLLGVAALQANAIRHNHAAELRSLATYQAYNMIDRMRANLAGVDAGSYNSLSGTPGIPSCTTCSPQEIAQKDITAWNNFNAALLPLGQGTVTRNTDTFTITVRWNNARKGATGLGCSGDDSVDLACIKVSTEL